MTQRLVAVPPEVAALCPFVEAGVFNAAEVQLAAVLTRLAPPMSDSMMVAVALAARGPRLGHICVEPEQVAETVIGLRDDERVELPWPDASSWVQDIASSPIVADPLTYTDEPFRPLVWDGRRLYLQRFYDYEVTVAAALEQRDVEVAASADVNDDVLVALGDVFGPDAGPDLQREAVLVALTNQVSVIAGGPGTGKTRTVARLLAVARRLALQRGETLYVALAAPTGKAASRMTEAVQGEDPEATDGETKATTLHHLLGWAPGNRAGHDELHPLPHDLVIVDETSMVPLQMMARLLRALKPTARLVLVGDPNQLASVEAGSVLDDLVGPSGKPSAGEWDGPLRGRVTLLQRMHRYDEASSIAALADAVRRGDEAATLAVLEGGHPDVHWVQPDDAAGLTAVRTLVADAAVDVVRAALSGDVAAGLRAAHRVKVLCATRRGSLGLFDWSERIESVALAEVPEARRPGRWFVGRPVMVTANDVGTGLFNGDVGLVVPRGDGVSVAMQGVAETFAPSRLDQVESWWAMTIHKSQGSEFAHAVASLPTSSSPILTRELLYTAVTRAKEELTIVATEAAIRTAVSRPAARASGLQDKLWSHPH